MMLLCILLMACVCCSGLPIYDPRQVAVISALDASLVQVNSQSRGRNLLRVSQTRVMTVVPSLQVRDAKDVGAVFEVTLQFSVRETTCSKNTAMDPRECEFRTYMETPCESQVLVSHGKALVLKAHCNLRATSSSESHSSEEMFLRIPSSARKSLKTSPGRFPSQWDPHGKRNHNLNPRWEEEDERVLDYFQLE